MTNLTDSKGSLLNNVRHLLVAMPELIINTCSIFLGGSSTLNLLSRPFFSSQTLHLTSHLSGDFGNAEIQTRGCWMRSANASFVPSRLPIFVSSQVTILTNGAVVFNERISCKCSNCRFFYHYLHLHFACP